MWDYIKLFLFVSIWTTTGNCNEEKVVIEEENWIHLATNQLKIILEQNEILNVRTQVHHVLPPNYMIELYHNETQDKFLPLLDNNVGTVRCIMGKWESLGFSIQSLIPEFGTKNEVYHNLALDELLRIAYKPFLLVFSSTKASPVTIPSKEGTKESELLDKRRTPVASLNEQMNVSRKDSNRIPVFNSFHLRRINQGDMTENNELENSLNPIWTLGKAARVSMTRLNEALLPKDNEISGSDQFLLGTPFPLLEVNNDERNPSVSRKRRSHGDNNEFSNDFLSYHSSIEDDRPNGFLSDYHPHPVKSKIYTRIEEKIDNRILPLDNSYFIQSKGQKNKNKKSRRRSKSKIKNQNNYPQKFKTKPNNEKNEHYQLQKKIPGCNIQRLSIPLLDYDWAEQIIAPVSFPLNYCSGTCSVHEQNTGGLEKVDIDYYNEEEMNPWVLNSFLWPKSSSSSCIPTKLNRLSLLYVDKFDTIVLKSYPNATITDCSCHSL